MSDQAAFLAAIAADPADDTARLVYADWLDEHPDVDDGRAEFIRWQCGLLKVPELRTLQYFTTEVHRELRRARNRVYASIGNREVSRAESLRLMVEARPVAAKQFNEYDAHRVKSLGRECALLAAHELRWRSAGACPACGCDGGHFISGGTWIACSACDGCGDVGMLLTKFVYPLTQVPEAGTGTTPELVRVEFRRGFVEQITAPRLADVYEAYRSGYDDASDTYRREGYRPTARAKAWLTRFPTTTRIVAADRVPANYLMPEPEHHSWWDGAQGGMRSGSDVPGPLFAEMWELYPDARREPGGEGVMMLSFATAAAATDALAVALAGLVWRAVNPLPPTAPG